MDAILEILKPTIVKPEISLDNLENDQEKEEMKAGGTSPLIQMSGHTWKDSQISKFELKYGEEFLPELEFVIKDKNEIISTDIASKIETVDVFLRSDNTEFEPIKMTFLVVEFEKLAKGEYEFTCELFVKGIDDKFIKSYDGTSFDVIKDMCKELGLGFASNITSTNDNQKWLRLIQSTSSMIAEIAESAWVDETSAIVVWVDVYYCLNFFDMQKSFSLQKDSFDKVTETNSAKDFQKEKAPVLTELVLSDHKDKSGTANFVDSYQPVDRRGSVEKAIGFERALKTNDLDGNSYHEYSIKHEVLQ